MTILITGGCGFIGTNFISKWLEQKSELLINYDNLTYSANFKYASTTIDPKKYIFIKGNILDTKKFETILLKYLPNKIINFAAETHVDNSIIGPNKFIQTNINGTLNLINVIKKHLENKNINQKSFKFIQISTDEVFGSLAEQDKSFDEESPYRPNNPYSASKASADLLIRSYQKTYGFPAIITHCTNNYGKYQNREKLIPKTIFNAIKKKNIPIYGSGKNIRDWIHVDDNCEAILGIIENGKVGEIYNVGARNEIQNIEVVKYICDHLDRVIPMKNDNSYNNFIKKGFERPGHDYRYSINPNKLEKQIRWKAKINFKSSLKEIVSWYINYFKKKLN